MNAFTTRRGRLLAATGIAAVAALALAGCDATGGTTDSPAPSDSSTADGIAGEVQALEAPLSDWPVPTDKVSDATVLKGKTVYYVPVTLQSTQFDIAQVGLTQALQALGASIQVCDGQGIPTTIASCIGQATQAGAAAIVADAIQYELAGNAFDAAQAAGIPVIIADQAPSSSHPDTKTLVTITGEVGDQMDEALAKFIVADSDGKADVLANQATDGSSPAEFFKAAQAVYDANGVKVTINPVSSANFPLVAPSTSAALLKDPNIDYLHVQYGQYSQPSIGGIQSAGLAGKVKVVTGASQLSELQAVQSGDLAAAVSPSAAYEGWIFADAALRLAAGDTVPDYAVPYRLFTSSNIGSVTLSDDAVANGSIYGPTTSFADEFKQLWGVN